MEIGDCVLLMEGHTAAVTDLAVANEGSVLVTSSADHTARVWTLDKGQCRAVLQGHTAAVNAVAVDRQGRFAVTASADATGRVWDLHSGQCAHVLRGHGAGAAGAGKICTEQHLICLFIVLHRPSSRLCCTGNRGKCRQTHASGSTPLQTFTIRCQCSIAGMVSDSCIDTSAQPATLCDTHSSQLSCVIPGRPFCCTYSWLCCMSDCIYFLPYTACLCCTLLVWHCCTALTWQPFVGVSATMSMSSCCCRIPSCRSCVVSSAHA